MLNIASCVLCNNQKNPILHRYGILAKGGPTIKLNNAICKKCGLVFLNPRPGADDYRKVYQEYENSRHNCRNESEIKQMMGGGDNFKGAEVYKFLEEYFKNGKKVLDIGCGFGHISNSLKNTYGCDVSAIEPSELLAKTVNEKLGINVWNGQFDDFVVKNDKKFNVLIMHHVFEHFTDPVEKLHQFKTLLFFGGVVYIEVPDVSSFSKPVSQFFDYMHPYSYSPKTFKELVYKNGYKIIKFDEGKKYRIRAVLAPIESEYPDADSGNYWERGCYAGTLYFIRKKKIFDFIRRIL